MITLLVFLAILALLATVLACAWQQKRSHTHTRFAANISEGTHEGSISKLTDAAITTRFLFVKHGTDSNHIAVCSGTTDIPLGVCDDEAAAAELPVNVNLLGAACRTRKITAAGAITIGDLIATTAAGKAQTAVSTQYACGRAMKAATADGDVIEFDPVLPTVALA